MDISLTLFFIAIGLALIWALPFSKLRMPWSTRLCQGKQWRLSFPDASKEEIRRFLEIFAEGFAFRDQEKLKFTPTDQLMDIYRTLYPAKWMPDALEFETLATLLKSEYGVNFGQIWHDDLTLGQLFSATRKSTEITEGK